MSKLFKLIAIIVLAVLFAGVVGVGWLQYYMNSPKFVEQTQRVLSKMLNTEVKLGKFHFNVFSGFSLDSLEVASPAPNNDQRFLSVGQVQFSYSLQSLLKRKLVIRELSLQKPELTLRYQVDGTSNFPQINVAKSEVKKDLNLDVMLNRFAIKNGKFSVVNPDKVELFVMQNAALLANYQQTQRGVESQGDVEVGKILLGSKFEITDAKSSMSYVDKKLSLPSIKGKAYQGDVTGLIEATFDGATPSFNLNLKLMDADLSSMLGSLKEKAGWIEGKFSVTHQLQGSLLQPRLVTGGGNFEIKNPSFKDFVLFRDLAQIFQIKELENIQFKDIRGTFKISDQKINFFNIEAVADHVQISSAGGITFDRELDFDVLLAFDETIVSRLPEAIKNQLNKRDDQYHTITFHVTGTLSEMRTNLSEKLVGAGVGAVLKKVEEYLPEGTAEKVESKLRDLFKTKPKQEAGATNTTNEVVPTTVTPPSSSEEQLLPQNP